MQSDNSPPRMIGESACFLEMQEHVSRVAPLNKPVLIVGERGTGKELIAARLHYLSRRWQNNFLKINCAAVSDSLLESQLFGHEAGAFTGASSQKKGYFERADGGTLFLDELANTAMPVQEKILRLIEYGEFERLGGNQTIKVDVRIVAATNEDLPNLARAKKFRDDLLDRLAFDVITLPPLRHRSEDILVLAEHFAVGMVKEMGGEYFSGFSQNARRMLLNHTWPGNVRELKNVIERAVYQSTDKHINHLVFNPFDSPYRLSAETDAVSPIATDENSAGAPPPVRNPVPDLSSVQSVDFCQQVQEFEIQMLRQAMEKCQYNQRKTAEFLQLSYHQLRGYLRKYDLLG
jgi:psp operon transcriptional activator